MCLQYSMFLWLSSWAKCCLYEWIVVLSVFIIIIHHSPVWSVSTEVVMTLWINLSSYCQVSQTHRLCLSWFSVSPSSVLSPLCSLSLSLAASCAFTCTPFTTELSARCVWVCLCIRVCVLMKLTNPLLLLHPLQTRPDKQMKYACSAICFIFSWQWPSAQASPEKYTLRLTKSLQCVASCFSHCTVHTQDFAFIPGSWGSSIATYNVVQL